MITLPIIRPGPFINHSIDPNNSANIPVFVEEPAGGKAFNYIDPVNGACDESEHWKWRYYLKQETYNFDYASRQQPAAEAYHTFKNREATNITAVETKKLTDKDSVLFDAGWSYTATQDFEWELIYRCKNGGTSALHGCYAKYQYPAEAGAEDTYVKNGYVKDGYVTILDPDNGEINEINRRVLITLPKTVFPKRVSLMTFANVGEDIGEGAEIEFEWRFGPVGSFNP
jgi:hypothetical protein